jgi:hypothetical protein
LLPLSLQVVRGLTVDIRQGLLWIAFSSLFQERIIPCRGDGLAMKDNVKSYTKEGISVSLVQKAQVNNWESRRVKRGQLLTSN